MFTLSFVIIDYIQQSGFDMSHLDKRCVLSGHPHCLHDRHFTPRPLRHRVTSGYLIHLSMRTYRLEFTRLLKISIHAIEDHHLCVMGIHCDLWWLLTPKIGWTSSLLQWVLTYYAVRPCFPYPIGSMYLPMCYLMVTITCAMSAISSMR